MQTAPFDLRRLREERAHLRHGTSPAPGGHLSPRLVPVSRAGPAHEVGPGDIAVLDSAGAGRRSLIRLAEELALRGAAGLVVSGDAVAPLSPDLRKSIEERIPLLVVDSEWDRARAWLLEPEPSAAHIGPESVVRGILRGHGQAGPLPGDVDPVRPIQAFVILADPAGRTSPPLEAIEEIAAAEAELADPRSFVLAVEGTVAVLSHPYGRTHDAHALAPAIMERWRSSRPSSVVTIGIGRPYPGVAGMRRTYREAKWAATVAEMMWGGNRVASFRDLGIYRLLEPFLADPSASDTQEIEKLIEHDRRNQTSLVPTVEAYLDAGRSGDAAASLFVHRNTIGYRLRAVRRVTGLDVVGDPGSRLLLEVQIRLARLWGILPAAPAHSVVRRSRRRRS
jgi:hypothetical protein